MDLNDLLRTLNDNKKYEEKNEILEIMDLLKDSLGKVLVSCRKDGAKAGEEFNVEKLKEIKVTTDKITNMIEEINTLSIYKDNLSPSSISIIDDGKGKVDESLDIIDLLSNLTFTKPKQILIENDVLENNTGTWTSLLNVVANFFANKFPTRFGEYVKSTNNKNLECYRFSDRDIPDKNTFYIQNVREYLIYHGSANDIGGYINEMIKFFNYSGKCIVYGIRKENTNNADTTNSTLDTKEYRVNDYINHTTYGIGRILDIDEKTQKITIDFAGEAGTKIFPFNQVNTEHFTPMTSRHFN